MGAEQRGEEWESTLLLYTFNFEISESYISYLFKNTLETIQKENKQNQHLNGLTIKDVASRQARPKQQPG